MISFTRLEFDEYLSTFSLEDSILSYIRIYTFLYDDASSKAKPQEEPDGKHKSGELEAEEEKK